MNEGIAPHHGSPTNSFDSQYKRLLDAAECRTQKELAQFLEIHKASIFEAKKNKVIPSSWLTKLFKNKQINPEWIQFGIGEKYDNLAKVGSQKDKNTKTEFLIGCSTDELIHELVRRELQSLSAELSR